MIISALGYFVDIYDLLLFSIVRVKSLSSLGVPADQLLSTGVFLINTQMTGLILGGILWGILGDKKGRVTVLFGSIFLYSVANILNAFVTSVNVYAALRFIAGVGLAGELGAAIALVSEVMSKETRGYGTTIVAGFGILGAVFAGVISDIFSWQTCFIIGGALGLLLLLLRVSMLESGMFKNLNDKNVRKGDVRLFFSPPTRALKYLWCILIGVPIWFVIGILMTFSPELAKELNIIEPISAGKAILFSYAGLSVGDFFTGMLSQKLQSRKKVVAIFLLLTLILTVLYTQARGYSANEFYALCATLGFCVGYWAVFITTAAEHFGTNLRATVSTTVPNFVRGSVVPLTLSFNALGKQIGLISAALCLGIATLSIAFFALYRMEETFAKNLDYIEN